MPSIFKSLKHQQEFNTKGFIVLPFLEKEEVEFLSKLFDEMHPNFNKGGFFSGSYSDDYSYKKKASETIVRVFKRRYEELFENYTPFGAAFLCKSPGEGSVLGVHQDWTIVDESKGNLALNCWVPLCDVNKKNGTLKVLPGSQYANHKVIRSPTLPFFFTGNEDLIHEYLIPIEVPAGTAVILNQSVVHYSLPNTTNKVRKAITAGVKTANAQMYFYYKIPNKNLLEVFEMEDDFLISFKDFFNDIRERPYLGKSIGIIPSNEIILNKEELNRLLNTFLEKSGIHIDTNFYAKSQSNDFISNFIKTINNLWSKNLNQIFYL